jgi:hypothetical protein
VSEVVQLHGDEMLRKVSRETARWPWSLPVVVVPERRPVSRRAGAADVAKRTRRLLKRALGLPDATVKNARRGRNPRPTAGCAADIRRAADRVPGDLGG